MAELDDIAPAVLGFPDGPERHLAAAIEHAEQRGDHAAMLRDAEELSVRAPRHPAGPMMRARALVHLRRMDAAERVLAQALTLFPECEALLQAHAELADTAGNPGVALERWAALRKQFPASSSGFIGALRSLRGASRLDLAPPLIAEGLSQFPEDRELLSLAARTAESAQDIEGASRLWQRLMVVAPHNPRFALSAALALRGGSNGRAKRWPDVFRRLEETHARFPKFAPAFAAYLECLVTAGRVGEAAALSDPWGERFPESVELGLARAQVAAAQGGPQHALDILAALRERTKRTPATEAAYIKALSAAGRDDAADAACAVALATFPAARKLLSEHARLATRRGDWQTAQDRLQAAQKQLPTNAAIAKELLHARIQLAGQADAEDNAAPAEGDAALFARFESLGGSALGCEFGTVQRGFGTESLGLLRWTRIGAEDLIRALSVEFEGVGSDETTMLKTVRNAGNVEEYVTSDRKFGMKSNTFVKVADAPFDKMLAQTCRRLRFLRGRLLEDLRLGEKIFVFKAFHPLDDATVGRLHDALRRYGDVALLCVMKARGNDARGSVRQLGTGLYVGYVGFFMKDADRNPGADMAGWHAVCLETCSRFLRERAAARTDEAA